MQYITKGTYASFTFTLENCDRTPLDLTNLTAKFIVKYEKNDLDADAVLTSTLANSDTNILMFQFDSTETAALTEGEYYCALKIFNSTDDMNAEVFSDELEVMKGVFND